MAAMPSARPIRCIGLVAWICAVCLPPPAIATFWMSV